MAGLFRRVTSSNARLDSDWPSSNVALAAWIRPPKVATVDALPLKFYPAAACGEWWGFFVRGAARLEAVQQKPRYLPASAAPVLHRLEKLVAEQGFEP
jgi:hypothetical protein